MPQAEEPEKFFMTIEEFVKERTQDDVAAER
jgi:uncharacterized short protein YbdD (DUF466 family)